jgi:hypothetical protein
MHPNRHQELDISLDEHVLRDMESVNSGRFSLEDKASPARAHFILSLDGAADAGGRRPRRWQEECRAAEEQELVRVRAELRAAQERVEELEGANLLLANRLQGKDEVVAAPGPPRRRGRRVVDLRLRGAAIVARLVAAARAERWHRPRGRNHGAAAAPQLPQVAAESSLPPSSLGRLQRRSKHRWRAARFLPVARASAGSGFGRLLRVTLKSVSRTLLDREQTQQTQLSRPQAASGGSPMDELSGPCWE